jgi:hypothetical protein
MYGITGSEECRKDMHRAVSEIRNFLAKKNISVVKFAQDVRDIKLMYAGTTYEFGGVRQPYWRTFNYSDELTFSEVVEVVCT